MFNVKLLVSLLSQTCEKLVEKKKKGEAEMHWTVGLLIGLLYRSNCVGLYHRTVLNYFNPLKIYLILNSGVHDNGPPGEAFTETCPVYRYSSAVVHDPSLQVFWYRHSFIMFNCLLIFIPLSSSYYGL